MATNDIYTVTRSATIAAPPERIHPLLVDFHEWRHWSPWEDVDPDMERTHDGAARGEGARYAWDGNRKAGAGSMEITEVEDDRVEVDLRFTKPFKATNTIIFRLAPVEAGTEVTWEMTGRRTLMTRVIEVFRSMDRMVGPDFERGLSQLRAVAERG